jgi:PAS domain S-box-containing protein
MVHMDYSFADLVDINRIRRLAENLYRVTGIPIGIMGADGTIYMEVGWHDVCARFHLLHPQARQCHIEMTQQISGRKAPGFFVYRCGNGMHHAVTPLILDGCHIASIYLGQFFYDQQEIDLEYFRTQARQFGFDEHSYLDALKTVPVYDNATAQDMILFFQDMLAMMASTGLARFKEMQADKERIESEHKYRHLFETMTQGVIYHDPCGKIISANPAASHILGLSLEQLLKFNINDSVWKAIHEDGDPFANQDHPGIVSLHTGKPVRDVVMGVFNPRIQQYSWIMINATPLFTAGETTPHQVYVTFTDITNLKHAQEALQESRTQFQELTRMLPQPIFVTDTTGRLTFTNQQALLTFGYSQEEMEEGINVLDTIIAEDRSRGRQNLANIVRDQVSANEYTALRKDKSTFPAVIYTTGIWQENTFCGFRGVVVDLSIVKKAEETARQGMKLFQTLFNNSLAGVALHELVFDENNRAINYRMLDINPGTELIMGIKRNETIGKLASEVYKTQKPPLLDKFAQVVKSGVPDHFETYLPAINKYLDISISPLDKGLFAAIINDISGRKRADEILADSEARMLEAQMVSHTGSWDLDLATQTMWGSVEAHHIYGLDLTPNLLLPLPLVQAMVEKDYRPILDQALKDLILFGEEKPYNVEFFIYRHDDNERRAVHSIARLVRDEQGRPTRVAGTIQDITERKMVEEEIRRLNNELELRVRQRTIQLEAANKELEAFAYSVSHDLRAPLRALNGYSHMLSEDYGPILDETGRSYLQHINAASINMARLIDDILKLSRITRSEMKIEPVDFSALALQIFTELKAEQPGRSVTWSIMPGLMIKADPSLMQIALTNLLNNAWKFTSKKEAAQIAVGVEDYEGLPVYFVSDNGAGFDMSYQHKLFNAFQRLHTEQDFEGTGIGLAIVQRIVQRHGGSIWAEGTPGKGATFKFTLISS